MRIGGFGSTSRMADVGLQQRSLDINKEMAREASKRRRQDLMVQLLGIGIEAPGKLLEPYSELTGTGPTRRAETYLGLAQAQGRRAEELHPLDVAGEKLRQTLAAEAGTRAQDLHGPGLEEARLRPGHLRNREARETAEEDRLAKLFPYQLSLAAQQPDYFKEKRGWEAEAAKRAAEGFVTEQQGFKDEMDFLRQLRPSQLSGAKQELEYGPGSPKRFGLDERRVKAEESAVGLKTNRELTQARLDILQAELDDALKNPPRGMSRGEIESAYNTLMLAQMGEQVSPQALTQAQNVKDAIEVSQSLAGPQGEPFEGLQSNAAHWLAPETADKQMLEQLATLYLGLEGRPESQRALGIPRLQAEAQKAGVAGKRYPIPQRAVKPDYYGAISGQPPEYIEPNPEDIEYSVLMNEILDAQAAGRPLGRALSPRERMLLQTRGARK